MQGTSVKIEHLRWWAKINYDLCSKAGPLKRTIRTCPPNVHLMMERRGCRCSTSNYSIHRSFELPDLSGHNFIGFLRHGQSYYHLQYKFPQLIVAVLGHFKLPISLLCVFAHGNWKHIMTPSYRHIALHCSSVYLSVGINLESWFL